MGAVLGELLPLAIGIAVSPVPIIAAILMLLSPKARSSSLGFLLGWVLGIVVAVVVFTLLASVLPSGDDGGSQPVAGVIKIVAGALLLLLALKQWRSRPASGEEAQLPKWMSAIDSMTAGKALGLGFLLAAVNPKNLLLAVSAGVVVGASGLTTGDLVVVVAVFTVLAASTVLVPVLGYLAASQRMAAPLASLRGWLVENNATIMAVLLLVMGASVVGKGIGSF